MNSSPLSRNTSSINLASNSKIIRKNKNNYKPGDSKQNILLEVKRLIYVSCGFKSFQRDASILLGLTAADTLLFLSSFNSSIISLVNTHTTNDADYPSASCSSAVWKLVHAEGHVLFPGSDHIETLAIFDRI
jgi:hypothetical protein